MQKIALSLTAACALLLPLAPAGVAAPHDYQATGPIVSMTDTTITIKYHNKEDWEFSRDAAIKPAGGGELRVGDKITIHYTMTATAIEATKPTKREHKAPMDNNGTPAASPSPSPSKPAAAH